MPDFDAIARELRQRPAGTPQPVAGGCIHRCYRWGSVFLKINDPGQAANFAAEARGLAALAATATIRVPEVIGRGLAGGHAFLALEFLELRPTGDETRLGEELAALHQHVAPRFGFDADNFIGATPQENGWCDSWPVFFRDRRLAPLLRRLGGMRGADTLLARLPELLPEPPASLLHGDLWGGNRAFLPDGRPVVFDPACFHGHAACDLAMTGLFGGFGAAFHDAYHACAPADFTAPELHDLYNLYHLLNHALLFGGGYASQAREVIARYAEN